MKVYKFNYLWLLIPLSLLFVFLLLGLYLGSISKTTSYRQQNNSDIINGKKIANSPTEIIGDQKIQETKPPTAISPTPKSPSQEPVTIPENWNYTAIPVFKPIEKKPGWLTYTNTVHNYSVQYPWDWKVDDSKANRIEDFSDSTCCNVASLIIYKDNIKWELNINILNLFGESPRDLFCATPPKNDCYNSNKKLDIMGISLVRQLYVDKISNKTIGGVVNGNGFGQIGIKNEFHDPEELKYSLRYSGADITQEVNTLDTISQTLQLL